MTFPTTTKSETGSGGLPMALAAYGIWGLFPIFLQLLKQVPPIELLGWRIIFTLPFCLLLVGGRKQTGELLEALKNPKTLFALLISASVIGVNWLIFLIAVAEKHVLATSLGYYINPLVSVLFGTALLGERLSRLQWIAVVIACAGIAILLSGALDTLAVSLSLALSFALYGLVRKQTSVSGMIGLTVEALVLYPFAIAIVGWYALQPTGTSFGHEWDISLYLVGSGIITGLPLMMFAAAAQRLTLSTLGFTQYITPTLSFLTSIMILGESLDRQRLLCFAFIWIAVALFSYDILRKRRTAS